MQIIVKKGDITKVQCDAIVNSANSFGWMGGGVAGAIKKAGGEEIEKEAVQKAIVPVGEAVITTAGSLPCKSVIHAPTMDRPAETSSKDNVAKAMFAALICAEENKIKSIAFPGMGTGVGEVSPETAAKTMISVIKGFKLKSVQEIIFIDLDSDMINAFNKFLK